MDECTAIILQGNILYLHIQVHRSVRRYEYKSEHSIAFKEERSKEYVREI